MTEQIKVKSYKCGDQTVRAHTRGAAESGVGSAIIGAISLAQTLASTDDNNVKDTLLVKTALEALGYYFRTAVEDKELNPFPNEELFDAVKEFQRDNNLKVDGIIKPGGETEKAMNNYMPESAIGEGAKEVARSIKGVYDTYKAYTSFEDKNFIYDKYRHAYVSCKGAQNGELAQKVTKSMGNLLEWRQVKEGIDTVQESVEDLKANEYGLKVGRKYPNKDCDDLVKDKYDKNKYWRK